MEICKNMDKRTIGQWGEDAASDYLKQNGYEILERNYHSHFGEIDIIAQERDCICFVEVKTRKNSHFGFPAEFVNLTKQQKIIKTAEFYLTKNIVVNNSYRFDIIEVFYYDKQITKINHLKGAFEL